MLHTFTDPAGVTHTRNSVRQFTACVMVDLGREVDEYEVRSWHGTLEAAETAADTLQRWADTKGAALGVRYMTAAVAL